MNSDAYRKLVNEKFKPENEREQVYVSIMLAVMDEVDMLKKQTIESVKSIKILAKIISEMRRADAAGEESAATEGHTQSGGPVITDQTPFPTGAAVSGPPGSGPRVTVASPAATPAEEIPAPDVSSGPAVNAAPIPNAKKPAAKNGAKDASA